MDAADENFSAHSPERWGNALPGEAWTPEPTPLVRAAKLPPVDSGPIPEIDGYEILAEIGRGTLGVVYQARDLRTNGLVALKWCSKDKCDFSEVVRVFDPEFFVPVITAGVRDEFVFVVSEYQAAGSLAARLNEFGPLSAESAAKLVRTLCQAVEQLHETEGVHGRLKPTDVLFSENGQPRLSDLKLVTFKIDETDPFRPPDRQMTVAGDIYRLGGILYAALTLQAPLRAGYSIQQEPKAPRNLNGSVPHSLQDICLKCLSRGPRERYTTVAHLAERLDSFLTNPQLMEMADGGVPFTPVRPDSQQLARSLDLDATVLAPLDSVATATTAATFPQFTDYEILAEIGRGGMGCVYKARHKRFGRVVALKTVLTGRSMGRGEVARFQSEIQSAARLDHPGIVPVYEAGESDGQHYFTMAYIDGNSLSDRIKQGTLDCQQAVYIVRAAAEAVAFAHRQGVIHRDIKPGNILLDRNGTVRVADFGLARQLDAADVFDDLPTDQVHFDTYQTVARLTVTGAVLGTPAYMAPEQALDTKRAKEPADIWALGAVLYACLTGRPPFIGANAMDTLTLVIEADPPPLRQLAPQVDPDLEAICLKCLTKDPLLRYTSTEEFVADLERWRTGRTPQAARLGRLELWQRWDAAYPEVLPLAVGVATPWLCGVQEGIFLGTMLASSRLRSGWPLLSSVFPACTLSVPLLVVSGFAADFAKQGPDLYQIEPDPTGVILELAVLVIAGPICGLLWCVGSQAAADHHRRWTFHLVTLAALAAGVGVYFGFNPLADQLRRVRDVTYWDYQPVWQSLSQFAGPSLWLMVVAGSCVSVGMLLAAISARRKRGRPNLERRPLIGQGVSMVAGILAVIAGLTLIGLAIAGLRPYAYLKLAYGIIGPAASALMVVVLGFSTGSLLSLVLRHIAPGDDPTDRQARFIGRVAAAAAALATLLVACVAMPESHPVELDTSGYFGPGPLLTIMESVFTRLGISYQQGWLVMFLCKFAVLTVPMTIAAAVSTRFIHRMDRKS